MSAGVDGLSTSGSTAFHDGERSLGRLVSAATADLSSLVHDEIALAKAEIRQDVKRGVAGGASLAVAGVVALAAIPMLSFAAAYGIHALGITLGWSFLIVGGAYLVLAAILGLVAMRSFKKVEKPQRTIEGAKATADVLRKARPRPATAQEKRAVLER
ncbi:phage holin family protein [Streptacidiphilus sp. ASG 303]|uniref:phage holin family protein n=1 Tax=Streptacidiphilus sp. ASG 303 TaxID=2896847 RepID=UPI001E4CC67E|nr:phage holin family protein [Streptacidiphilus sp. ASG 303]MCD0482421.1 phage holin family protein [Streptacidiphilus sp. ASG 303]